MRNIFLCLLLCSISLYAQEKDKEIKVDSTFTISLGPRFRKLVCHAIVREPQKTVNRCIVLYRFDFYKSSDSTLLFSFIDSNSVHISNHHGFTFSDVDKNGYRDLMFVTDETAQGVEYWSVFLFDPLSKGFFYDSAYSKYDFDNEF